MIVYLAEHRSDYEGAYSSVIYAEKWLALAQIANEIARAEAEYQIRYAIEHPYDDDQVIYRQLLDDGSPYLDYKAVYEVKVHDRIFRRRD